ncbi:hypothetical protein ACONUD_07375 [Microbulbifer harenosus]|uniref:Uncharacterized protein n=1 Tax=Microbulbifer harenosus TaxID=2576840 RepID=A0ABY2UII0_9GAMM|nr:hypothetical protein [Microbulbifer harenosus]TLM77545.1 hypothetical protein FDY93_07960 [Microbulbifer harenosus]
MNEEEKILKQWVALKEAGVERAKFASRKLFFIGILLTGIVAVLMFFKANSIFSALRGTAYLVHVLRGSLRSHFRAKRAQGKLPLPAAYVPELPPKSLQSR